MPSVNVTEATFGEVIESHPVVFVFFGSDWFAPSESFRRIYDAIAEEYPDVFFAVVDTNDQEALAAAANVASIPTLMAYRDRTLVYSEPGAMTATQLSDLIDAVKAMDMGEVH
jgi:thioredoxin 1